MDLFESAEDPKAITLDVKAIPCSAQGCNNDKQKAIDYLSNASIVVYYNRGNFEASKFEKPPIAYTVSRYELSIDSSQSTYHNVYTTQTNVFPLPDFDNQCFLG